MRDEEPIINEPAAHSAGSTSMDLSDLLRQYEATVSSRSREAGIVRHAADRGGNREAILRSYLAQHLPKKYGVIKGEVITKAGGHSHSADVLIYDAINCPVLYVSDTQVLPIEGVYGVIEVKSRLSRAELVDATGKIEAFKRLASRDLSVIRTREYVTVHRSSRPFGIVFGFDVADNSLDSLLTNWHEVNTTIHDVNYMTNLVVVLGAGILLTEVVDWSQGQIGPLLDTDTHVRLMLTQKKHAEEGEPLDVEIGEKSEAAGDLTFGRFLLYLLMMLEQLKLGIPDLGQYVDPDLPMIIHRES
jgi:hypothetical protein